MRGRWSLLVVMGAALACGGSPESPPDPSCHDTTVVEVGGRLSGDLTFDTGVYVRFASGESVVSYSADPVAILEHPGDPVRVCLISKPKDCPPGDERGTVYEVFDKKQGKSYSMPNSSHMCGGA